MKKTKVLVTGAGGFLGRYIARDLLKSGRYDVFSFSRQHYPHLDPAITQFQGDLKNFSDVKRALAGMDAVIHTASAVGMWGRYEHFYSTNVVGTENVLRAAREEGVAKCVYTSTPSVAFGDQSLCGVDESSPYPKKYLSSYAQTKALAEKKVLAASGPSFLTVALRPHLIFGPGDLNLIPRVIARAKKGQLKIVGTGDNLVDVTYVENASLAHLQALEELSPSSPLVGKAYFLGQGPVKLWDFINDVLKRAHVSPVTKKIPFWPAYFIGWTLESILKLIGKYDIDPPMTRFVALQLAKSHYYDHTQLKRDLNFTPLYSIEEGLEKLFSSSISSSIDR